jgi:hypothetical protein
MGNTINKCKILISDKKIITKFQANLLAPPLSAA